MADEIDLYFHGEGAKPRVIRGAPHETLREVLLRWEVIDQVGDETYIFIGECEEALDEPLEVEDGADTHAPVDIDLTLEVLELHRHRHVHHHRCRHVKVEVNFGGEAIHHRFSPATTIEVVTRWARRKFKLEGAAGDEYVLQICGTKTQPRSDEHLSQLVKFPDCDLCFNLVKEITPQGAGDEAA
jgi:hypothetical protein